MHIYTYMYECVYICNIHTHVQWATDDDDDPLPYNRQIS